MAKYQLITDYSKVDFSRWAKFVLDHPMGRYFSITGNNAGI